jgi:ADP-ribosylglycohydrolase
MNDIVQIDRRVFGAAIGDIIGSSYERKCDRIKTTKFDLFTERSQFTDDTVLTAAIALWLMESPEHDEALLRKNLLEMGLRYYDPASFTFGPGFSSWLLQEAGSVILGLPHVKGQSMGNGSAMRVGPVGWAFNTIEEVLSMAKESAECTHNHPEGIKGAQATALAIMMARQGCDKEEIRSEIEKRFDYNLQFTCDKIRPTYTWGGTCQDSVPQAIVAFLDGKDFEDSIRNAISIGGDSDTLGCITGSIAEAFFGVPADLRNSAMNYLPEEFQSIISEFENKFGNK